MAIGYFAEKEKKPTKGEIAEALGAKAELWDRLLAFIESSYQIPQDLSFGGRKYGWNLWYRKSGKSLVSLYPQKGYFVAQVVLGKVELEKALKYKFGKNVSEILKSAPVLHDGKWLFIKVRTMKDVKDVEELLKIKRRPRPSEL